MNSNHRNLPYNFSKIEIGETSEFEIVIDEDIHNRFSKISGDFSPIHCDKEFSEKSQFKKRIGYAFLLTSFLSKLYGEYLPGGSSICIKQDSKFIKPFFIGDTIKIKGEVTNKIESTKFVEIKTMMYRNDSELIFRGNGVVQIIFDGE